MTCKPLTAKVVLDTQTCTALERHARYFSRSRTKHLSLVIRGLVRLYSSLPPAEVVKLDSVLTTTQSDPTKTARQFLRELSRNSFSIPVNSQLIQDSDESGA